MYPRRGTGHHRAGDGQRRREILDGRAKDVYGHTVSGEVTFRGPVLADGSYEFSTTSGNIAVALPESPTPR